jgi:ABC-type bacteriocin/lantibiotic exporter with double-glycine peptidase domain
MKLKPFLQSLLTSIIVLGGIYALATYGTKFLFHIFVCAFFIGITTIIVYEIFDKDTKRRDHT